jgi:RNA polymerase sigma-70 factor (ECF subfamily)
MEIAMERGAALASSSGGSAAAQLADEEALVLAAARGDERAYGKLVQIYQARLYNFVRSMVRNAELAEDITQESFVKAFFSLSKLQNPKSFTSWLFRIANNNTLDYLRKKRLAEIDTDESIRESYVDMRSPELSALEDERIGHIRQALLKLKEDQRSILVMCDLQGLSYAEIAEVLKIPFGTVQSRIFYARKKLKEFLDESIIFGGES